MLSHPLYPKLRQLTLSGMLQTLDLRVVLALDMRAAGLAQRLPPFRIGQQPVEPVGRSVQGGCEDVRAVSEEGSGCGRDRGRAAGAGW